MHAYYKAFLLRDLRQFAAWREDAPSEAAVDAETVLYLRDDYAVVRDPFAATPDIVFAAASEDWVQFCQHQLDFRIPVESPDHDD
jgi:hypothetical protein